MKTYRIEVIVSPWEEGGYIAEVPSIQGCWVVGETIEQVTEDIQGCYSGLHPDGWFRRQLSKRRTSAQNSTANYFTVRYGELRRRLQRLGAAKIGEGTKHERWDRRAGDTRRSLLEQTSGGPKR